MAGCREPAAKKIDETDTLLKTKNRQPLNLYINTKLTAYT